MKRKCIECKKRVNKKERIRKDWLSHKKYLCRDCWKKWTESIKLDGMIIK